MRVASTASRARIERGIGGPNRDVKWEKRQAGEVLIELCDGTGKLIRKFREEMSPGAQQVRFGMQDLAAGFYLLRISSDGDQQTVPVIRQ